MMRNVQITVLIVFGGLLIACHSGNEKTGKQPVDTIIRHSNDSITFNRKVDIPYQVLSRLKEGNRHFVMKLSPSNSAHDSSYSYMDQIVHTRNEQHPIACILSCMDSRVPPEIIFDQGIGSLFVVRVAGNIEDSDILGSMEYAVAEKGVTVIIVLGHKNCGAISAAFGKVDPRNKELVSLIAHVKKDIVPNDKPPYDASSKHNVKVTIENILHGSQTIQQKQLTGKLVVVGALYDVGNGVIDWNTVDW